MGVPPLLLFWAAQPGDEGERALLYLWTFGAVIGIIASSWLVRETWREYIALAHHRRNDKALTLIAEANFRRELFRLLKFTCLFIIGMSVWLVLNTVVINRVMLVMVVALLFGNTILDLRERQSTHAILMKAIINRRH